MNLDYLGHLISFAFYWKSLLNKFAKEKSHIISLYFDKDEALNQYNNAFINIKNQLYTKLQTLQI